MIGAVCYATEEFSAKIYPAGQWNNINWTVSKNCDLGEQFVEFDFITVPETKIPLIDITEGIDGNKVLRLTETKRYAVKIDNHQSITSIKLINQDNFKKHPEYDSDRLIFQFVNYLGNSGLNFKGKTFISFEVVPDKMDYEEDYIKLTESIAQSCSQLLLDYGGTTTNRFKQKIDPAKTLLEQFIFLRQFCYSENILALYSSIRRNPDSLLEKEEVLKPFGQGIPSQNFFSNPFSFSREWSQVHDSYLPQQIAVTEKHESFDTPANRFLKFAFQRFNSICTELFDCLYTKSSDIQFQCVTEAKLLSQKLEVVLQSPFFDDIGEMDIVPQNNQVLQKREGYMQIFNAYSMIDLALQLKWDEEENVYKGESKNTALLYEYWLFFELYKIIKNLAGCKPLRTNETPFIQTDSGLTISLQEGKTSCQSFIICNEMLNLYYNREFSHKEFMETRYENSYSRPFRPDYTIAVFPCKIDESGKIDEKYNENEAAKEGLVSYIHFDAKYRITDLTGIIGKDEKEMTDTEFAEEKSDEVTNTYKRGDLLKMHTYNDAIRRTVGSYVLYPGDSLKKANFSLYDEIIPGVGAFAIKPSIEEQSCRELGNFILGLIEANSRNYTRLARSTYFTNQIVQEPSAILSKQFILNKTSSVDTEKQCILGYLRADSEDDYYNFLRRSGYLKKDKEFYFYYYAIKDGYVYSHHKDIAKINNFRFYTNPISKTLTYQIEPVLCSVADRSLVSKQGLIDLLKDEGFENNKPHSADFYYVLHLKVENENLPVELLPVKDVESVYGNDTFSPNSPKLINL